jgi:hypothetical protein
MPNYKLVVLLCAVVITLMGSVGEAIAPFSTRTTYLTFSAPVRLPGVTLPAGTYIFERPEAQTSLRVVRVLARDRTRIYLTAVTQLVERPGKLPAHQFVTLGEAANGMPAPVTAWFPLGDRLGNQFIY